MGTTSKPFVPCGAFVSEKDAKRTCDDLFRFNGQKWIPCKRKSEKRPYAIVRKS